MDSGFETQDIWLRVMFLNHRRYIYFPTASFLCCSLSCQLGLSYLVIKHRRTVRMYLYEKFFIVYLKLN